MTIKEEVIKNLNLSDYNPALLQPIFKKFLEFILTTLILHDKIKI